MKKSLFAILAVAACFASCSKVVETSVLDKPISFEGYIGRDAITRGSVIKSDEVDHVLVNAYLHYATEKAAAGTFQSNFMLNQAVEKTDKGWDYKPKKYWPATDRTIDFVAWIDPDKDADGGKITVDGAVLNLTVPTTAKDQVDLLVSNPVLDKNGAAEAETVEGRNTVPLTFKHLLSRIRFEITGKSLPNDGVNVVTLTELSLNGSFASEGTVNMRVDNPAVAATAGKTTAKYEILGSDLGLKGESTNVLEDGVYNTADQNAYLMLIPDQAVPDYIFLSYTVTTYEVDKDGKATTTVSGEPVVNEAKFKVPQVYEKGKAYAYKFTIEMDAISFTVDVENWAEETEDQIENDYPKTEEDNNEQGA